MTETSYRLVPWTLATIIATTFPHIFRVPVQISILVICVLLGRVYLHLTVKKMPKLWLKVILILLCFTVVLATFHTISGLEAGSSLLLTMIAVKTLEMNSVRDHLVLLVASFFTIVSFVLNDTSILSALYLVSMTGLCVFTLLKISAPDLKAKQLLPNAKSLLFYGLPLAIILFLLFPRIPGPLWGLPNTSGKAKSGLSDSMTPGSITDLVKSNALAFRVKFTDKEPSRQDLYWRGPVLHNFDGKTWSMTRTGTSRSSESNSKYISPDNINYDVILEPHDKRWLFVLDYAMELPDQAWQLDDFQVGRIQPVTQLTHYRASANTRNAPINISPAYILNAAKQLPGRGSDKTRELAEQWKTQYSSETAIVNAALGMFNKDVFAYTLSPQALDMSDSVDDFLFRTKEGFCEHYASAFVVLMRAAGIPARVVTGYLGGEKNYLSGYYRITQADAHAWAEVYLEGRGWTRVDPTAAIAPERIEQSLEDTFPDANLGGLFGNVGLYLRIESAWFALNTKWFEYVLDFNAEKQMKLLQKLGFSNPNWQSLIWLLVSGILLMTMIMSFQFWRQSLNRINDPIQKIYFKFVARLEKLGVNKERGEGPKTFSLRAASELKPQQRAIEQFSIAYIEARYFSQERKAEQIKSLKKFLSEI